MKNPIGTAAAVFAATLRDVPRIAVLMSLSFLVTAQPCYAAGPISLSKLNLRDVEGETIAIPPSNLTVVCFLGTECPLARLYGPRLQRLADAFVDDGVEFVGVISNVQDSPADIAEYARKHHITFPIAKDADQSVADAFAAERTPEVFVLDASGQIRYQGRIDDQYRPGIARSEPSQHDLRAALDSLVAGRPVKQPRTQGVGCLITRVPARPSVAPSKATVTFAADIAPILNQHCVECHREGEIGPFALTDYSEVVGWGQMLLEVIDEGRMPPWHADPQFGHFIGERRMPPEAREMIASWLDQGMPEGDPDDLPPTPQWNGGWQFSTDPDVELKMNHRPFVVPADGVVEYQYYVVDPGWQEDHWVRAAQVVPGDASVVHHIIVFVRPPDGSHARGIGWLGAYVPGQRMMILPPGHARRIPAGSKLVFQMHYTPNGRETRDISRVGVWFADPTDITHEVFTRVAINHNFEIPPHAEDYQVDMSLGDFPSQSRLLGATPHMHVRGRSFRLMTRSRNVSQKPKIGREATPFVPSPPRTWSTKTLQVRGGEGQGEGADVFETRSQKTASETLLHVPHYDFNWQHYYQFAEPLDLDRIESLDMVMTFDNSGSNPFNPAPDEFVTWGDQTWEEMAIAFFDIARPRGAVSEVFSSQSAETGEQIAGRQRVIKKHTEAFLAQMDHDGDGVVLREETPVTFQRFGFGKMDRNNDGLLDRNEIEAQAAERQ